MRARRRRFAHPWALIQPLAHRKRFTDGGAYERDSEVNGWVKGPDGNPVLKTFAIDEPAFVIDPATGKALGYRALAGSTNKCTNHNLNPDAALTNISASAGTLERVDDSANLPLSNQFDGNAFHLNNGTGGSVTITVTGQCGNTNAHSIGVLCRFTGTAPTVQLTGGDGAATCNNDYAETKSEDITPSASTDQWQLVVPDGTEVWFVANQLEEGAFISSWIETEGATGSTAADDATEPVSLSLVPAGTLVVSARTANGVSGDQVLTQMDFNSEDYRIRIVRNASREVRYVVTDVVTDGGTEVVNLNLGTVADGTDFRVAIRWGDNDFAGIITGGTLQTDATGLKPALNVLRHGRDTMDGDEWNGTIASVIGGSPYSDTDLERAV